jgi:hypothetical protein
MHPLTSTILAAPASTGAQVTGASVLLLMLGAAIFAGLRSKQLKAWELLVCGSFGLLLGSTALGDPLRSACSSLGAWLLGHVA